MASRRTLSSGWFHRHQPESSCRAGICQREKAEQYIKKGKVAIRWTRLSCYKFRDNAARLFQIQESQKIRSSNGCGAKFVPSTMIPEYGFHKPEGYLGNPEKKEARQG
jgi:16S rRNA U516 pseudouridylate synthase RsuA-like enzyme